VSLIDFLHRGIVISAIRVLFLEGRGYWILTEIKVHGPYLVGGVH